MRSVFSVLAVAWFVFGAITVPLPDDPAIVQTTGDLAPAMIHDIARTLFVGLALLAAAGVDLASIAKLIDRW